MSGPLRLRLWIVLLSLVSALAGFAGGLISSAWFQRVAQPAGAFAPFREAFVHEFELGPERRRALASVLDAYQQNLEQLEARGLETLEPELKRLNQQLGEILRNRVLPAERRERYDALASLRSPGDPPGPP